MILFFAIPINAPVGTEKLSEFGRISNVYGFCNCVAYSLEKPGIDPRLISISVMNFNVFRSLSGCIFIDQVYASDKATFSEYASASGIAAH